MGPTKTILLMRHAKSGWPAEGQSDHERTLDEVGLLQAPQIGTELRELELLPDLMLVSTAIRAQQTADALVIASGFEGSRDDRKRLYLAEPSVYFDLFAEIPSGVDRLLVIAHNPGIADLAEVLTGTRVEMCTAGLAHIQCEVEEIREVTSRTRAKLQGFHRPR